MKLFVKKATTDVTVYIFVQNSSVTTGAGLTGLVFNSASLVCYYVRPVGSATQLTLATQTVTGAHSDGGFVEVDATNMPGVYRLDLSDAVCATGVNSVVVMLKGATNMAPVLLEIQLTDFDVNVATPPVNVTQISGDATAADNLETMLDGTGGQTLSLGQLNIVNASGSAIVATSSGSNGHGIAATGNGTGHGIFGTGGSSNGVGVRGLGAGSAAGIEGQGAGANGHGIRGAAGASAAAGIRGEGAGAGPGFSGVGGSSAGAHGASFTGGSTSGNGILCTATGNFAGLRGVGGNGGTSGHGISGASGTGGGNAIDGTAGTGSGGHGFAGQGDGGGEGASYTGGTTGHGLEALGGATSGTGLKCTAQASGPGFSAQAAGTNPGGEFIGAGNGNGFQALGAGTGHGGRFAGGTTGNGIVAAAGATSGYGVLVTASGDFAGVRFLGGDGGTSGHGLEGMSGALGGDGIHGMAGGGSGGYGIRGVGDPGRPDPSVSIGPPGTFLVNVFETVAVHDRQIGGSAITGLPPRLIKNQDFNNFEFFMTDSADHVSAKTGLTITAQRSIDGAAFANCANSASEVGNGVYKINLAASDLNGDLATLRFTGTGADARVITIITQPS